MNKVLDALEEYVLDILQDGSTNEELGILPELLHIYFQENEKEPCGEQSSSEKFVPEDSNGKHYDKSPSTICPRK